jgi:hypothetical protein
VVFPNRDYLYGKFKNRQLSEICCYVTASGETYFFNFSNGASRTIAFIDANSTIIEIDNTAELQKVNSYISPKETNDKWRIISDILRA